MQFNRYIFRGDPQELWYPEFFVKTLLAAHPNPGTQKVFRHLYHRIERFHLRMVDIVVQKVGGIGFGGAAHRCLEIPRFNEYASGLWVTGHNFVLFERILGIKPVRHGRRPGDLHRFFCLQGLFQTGCQYAHGMLQEDHFKHPFHGQDGFPVFKGGAGSMHGAPFQYRIAHSR